MADAKRDNNYVPTLLAVSNADGVTPVTLYADPTTHRLLVSATGGVVGPGSSTDNAVARFNGTDGGTIQNSGVIIDDSNNVTGVASLGTTSARLVKGWFTDLEVTNAIAGSITGNAGTVTTITGLAPDTATTQASQPNITSLGTLTGLEVTNAIAGSITGNAGTVTTITGLAPDTATTQASQPNITSLGTLTGLTMGGNIEMDGNGIISTDKVLPITIGTGAGDDFTINTSLFVVEGDTGNVGIGTDTPDTILHVAGAITSRELSADPSDPDEGENVQWQSDGTGSGDDGDIMMKITAGGATKTVTLVDFSLL